MDAHRLAIPAKKPYVLGVLIAGVLAALVLAAALVVDGGETSGPSVGLRQASSGSAGDAAAGQKDAPTDAVPPAVAATGAQVSPNTVKPWLAATFPESFGGLYATRPDGSAYTIVVVGDPGPIRDAVSQRFDDPTLVGPLPTVAYQQGVVTLQQLQAAVNAIVADGPGNGTGVVNVGIDEQANGLTIDYVGPIEGVAETFAAKYGVPIASVTQRSEAPHFEPVGGTTP